MAMRLPQWFPAALLLGMGGALGWMLEPALTPETTKDIASSADRHGPSADAIGATWLPLATLEQRLQSLSVGDAEALLVNLDRGFWCGHPNGRDALRIVVSRMAERALPAELARQLFAQFRSLELPAGARAETLRNLTAALAKVPAVTPVMIGEALRGFPPDEIHAAAAMFAEERRGESIESDAAALQQLLVAAEMKADAVTGMANDLAAAAWFREQPEAAIAFAAKARNFDGAIFRPMLRQLHAVDPLSAVAALKLMSAGGKSPYWMGESAFLAGLSAAEFREVWSQVPKDERLHCLQGYAVELALQDPGNVRELARSISAAEVYPERVQEQRSIFSPLFALLPIFAERDAAACREWLSALPSERRVQALQTAATSNAAFARFCLADPDFSFNSYSAMQMLNAIAAEDLPAALRELPRVPPNERLDLEAGLHQKSILDHSAGNIGSILQAVEQLPEAIQNIVRPNIYSVVALNYQPQVEQWIASNSDSTEAQALRISMAGRDAFLSNAKLESLLAGSLDSINDSPGVADLTQSYVDFLSRTKPESASAWFARISEGDRKNDIAQMLARNWATTDTAAAVAWAEQLPPTPSRDDALLALAERQRGDPEEALRRIAKMDNPERRFVTAQTLVEQWALANPDRAMTIIAEAPLSAEQRLKLQAVVDSSPTRIRASKPAP